MTQQQFDKTKFYPGILAEYDGLKWLVHDVGYKERLLGLWPEFLNPLEDQYDTRWVRCENIKKIIHAPKIEI